MTFKSQAQRKAFFAFAFNKKQHLNYQTKPMTFKDAAVKQVKLQYKHPSAVTGIAKVKKGIIYSQTKKKVIFQSKKF